MKKLTSILLSSILLISNSYSISIEQYNYSSNFDNKCSLDLVTTSSNNSLGSKNTNYNSDIDDNIINDDTNDNIINNSNKRGRNWKKNKKRREKQKQKKQMQKNEDIKNSQPKSEINTKQDNMKNSINTVYSPISSSQNEKKLKEKQKKSQEDFKELLKEKLNIKGNNFNEQTIQDADNLIRKELKNISEKHAQEGNDDILEIIQDTLNLDLFKKAIASTNDDINYFINSRKFKMLGSLHQQIVIGADNGNTIYNRFSIDDNILNDYKNYYKQLVNFISTFFGEKIIDIIQDNYDSKIEQIRTIISSIYNKLEDVDELDDVDDIICFFINDEIYSEKNLQGNNILKIIANLAVAIHDCTQNAQYAYLQLAFGPKIHIGNSIIFENSTYSEVLKQFKTIRETFGIENTK